MKPYIIVVAYDGTNYHGWQEQKNQQTIAGTLQASFKKVFGHEIKTVGASRTDAGVHAAMQVARFYTDRKIDVEIMRRSWNGALPLDIYICSLEPSVAGFHPQHNVIEKTYQYHFSLNRPRPFRARYVHYHNHALDLEKMKRCLQQFVGTHDFFAFCTGDCDKGTVCTISTITLEFDKEYQAYCVTVCGKRFLHHMIRRIIGAALRIASYENRLVEEIAQAFVAKKADRPLPTAPARGLVLKKILYKN